VPKRRQVSQTAERRTVGYARVSTQGQADDGVSLEEQVSRIRAYGTATAREISDVVVDAGQSAKTLLRPGVGRILAGIQNGEVGGVVVCRLDRLTRSIRDLSDLLDLCKEYEVALISLNEALDTSSAGGRLFINLLGVISQWQREQIGENTSAALRHKRQTGCVYGRTPFGYVRQGAALLPETSQQAALRLAHSMRSDGITLQRIGRELTLRGIKPPRGSAWYASSVRAILESKIASEQLARLGCVGALD